jgi:FAD/FMN-containing dehydrogenase
MDTPTALPNQFARTTTMPECAVPAQAPLRPTLVPLRKDRVWGNWGKSARCRPELSFYPQTAEDLIRIVNFARDAGKRVRATGSSHSWSALVPTDDVLVYTRRLNRVTMDLSDESQPRVVVESGATIREVNDVLERHGYALPFNVVLESVRLGGLIATGSHGSGWNNRTLSDLAHSIEVVTASGQLRKFETGVDSDEAMNAVRLDLGMFGLVYRMTLDVQPSWNVRAIDRREPIERTLDNLPEQVASHDNLDLFWWPFCDQFWVKSWDRVESPITAKPRRDWIDNACATVTSRIHRETLRAIGAAPRLTPAACRMIFQMTPSVRDEVVEVVEAIHYRRAIEVAKMGCVEVAFKIDRDFENVKWAINLVREQTARCAARGQYPLNVVLNARFIHNSDCLLSPAFGAGHTCYIEILSRTNEKQWLDFSGAIAREWLQLPQARPHWAKQFRHIPGVVEHLKTSLGDNIARFNAIKQRLQVDPGHMFVNRALQEIFL